MYGKTFSCNWVLQYHRHAVAHKENPKKKKKNLSTSTIPNEWFPCWCKLAQFMANHIFGYFNINIVHAIVDLEFQTDKVW